MTMTAKNNSIAVGIARKSIPFMSENNIPITPQNYCVWYEYFHGRMLELKVTLDDLIKSKTGFDDKLNHEIYTRFFTRNHNDEQEKKLNEEIKAVEEVNATADKILAPITRELDGASKSTEDYGIKLKEMAGQIKNEKDIDNMHSIMVALAKETKKITSKNKAISTGLKDSAHQLEDLSLKLAHAKAEARIDDLTKMLNRRAFNERLTEIIETVNKKKITASLAFIDIDKFKRINDIYGHPVGDKALASIAAQLIDLTNNNGEVFRIGGEEFAAILPDCSLNKALKQMESVRASIGSHQFAIRDIVETITISIGIAQIKKGGSQEEAERLADMALYLAKESGRNNVKTEKDLKAQDAAGA